MTLMRPTSPSHFLISLRLARPTVEGWIGSSGVNTRSPVPMYAEMIGLRKTVVHRNLRPTETSRTVAPLRSLSAGSSGYRLSWLNTQATLCRGSGQCARCQVSSFWGPLLTVSLATVTSSS
jgi:hypothetical protein